MINIKYIMLFAFMLLLSSCGREDEVVPVDLDKIDFPSQSTDFTLDVAITEGGNPFSGAEVSVGSKSLVTNTEGKVTFENAEKTEFGFTIVVRHPSYFTETVIVSPQQGNKYILKSIELTKRDVDANISTGFGETFNFNSVEAIIDVPSDAWRDGMGNAYEGEVILSVFAAFLEGSQPINQAPFIFQNTSLSETFVPVLEYYIVAFDKEGNKLNLAVDKALEVSFVSTMGSAVLDDIAVYEHISIDPLTGLAFDSQRFTFGDSGFKGEVSRLGKGFIGNRKINVDVSMNLLTSNNNPLAFQMFQIAIEGLGTTTVTTDRNGLLVVSVPTEMNLSVSFDLCDVQETLMLGTFSSDTNIGNQLFGFSGSPITGTFVECDDQFMDIDGELSTGFNNELKIGKILPSGEIVGTYFCDLDTLFVGFLATNFETGNAGSVVADVSADGDVIDLGDVKANCNGQLWQVSGNVFYDADDNGTGESPVEIFEFLQKEILLIDVNENILTSTEIQLDGSYLFSEIPSSATYLISVQLKDGLTKEDLYFYDVTNTVNFNDVMLSWAAQRVFPENGSNMAVADFHFNSIFKGSVSGRVLYDTNGDGVGDAPVQGTKLELFESRVDDYAQLTLYTNTATDGDGNFSFTDVPNGAYLLKNPTVHTDLYEGDETPEDGVDGIEFDNPDGFIPVYIKRGEDDTDNVFVVEEQEEILLENSAYGFVQLDTDGDNIPDIGYEGEILLIFGMQADGGPDGGLEIANTMSGPGGSYKFINLPPGEYIIQSTGFFPNSAGLFDSFERIYGEDLSLEVDERIEADYLDEKAWIPVTIKEGQTDTDNNFLVRINE